jgi:hypothetical protein
VLWIIFIFSIVFLISLLLLSGNSNATTPGNNTPFAETTLIVWVPLITALVSLIGALTTSILTMRRDSLESQKIELEVSKLQLEIDKLKKDAGSGLADRTPDQNPK